LDPTGHVAATPRRRRPADSGRDLGERLPSSERNMLTFVAMLLAHGAIAVVATTGVVRFG
jgi:hypothetical protein